MIANVYEKKIHIEPFNDLKIDRSLNSDKFQKMCSYTPPSWEDMIAEMHAFYMRYFKKLK